MVKETQLIKLQKIAYELKILIAHRLHKRSLLKILSIYYLYFLQMFKASLLCSSKEVTVNGFAL